MHNITHHIINSAVVSLSLATSVGVFIHDTKVDQAATTLFAVPVIAAGFESVQRPMKIAGDPHTHSERGSLAQAMRGIGGGTPRIQPRDDNKLYQLQKKVAKGVHAFDGYYLPIDF